MVRIITAPYRVLAFVKEQIDEQANNFSQKSLALFTSPYQLAREVKERIDRAPGQIAGLLRGPASLPISQAPVPSPTTPTTKDGSLADGAPQKVIVKEKETIREVVLANPPAPSQQQTADNSNIPEKLSALKDELTQSFVSRINTLAGGFGFNTNRFDDLFVQKSLELAGKLTQPASNTGSPVTFSSSVTTKDLSATALTLSSTLTVSGTATSTIAGPLKIAGGLTAGSGNVQIIDSTGKIPTLSSSYFASLPSLFSSIGNASSTVQFSASGINDTLSFEATGGLLTISFDSTTKRITFSASAPTLLSVLQQGADASTFTSTVQLGGTLQVPTLSTASGNLTLSPSGDLLFYSASNKITSSGNLTLAGTFAVNGNATSTIENNLWVKGALTVGSSSLSITQSGIGSTGNLRLSASGDIEFFSSANKLTSLGNLTIAGAFTVSGTASSTIGGPLIVTGDITTSGKLRETAGALIPSGAVLPFNLSTCPPGWSPLDGQGGRPDARGRYAVFLPASGTLAGTAGTALTNVENRAVGQHDHAVDPPSTAASITDPGHRHGFKFNIGGGYTNTFMQTVSQSSSEYSNTYNDTPPWVGINTTGITASVDIASLTSGSAGSVAGTNAPYIQLLGCQKD